MKISLVPIGGVIQYKRKDCVWVKDDFRRLIFAFHNRLGII
jgi:hypothetical protein